MNVHRVEYKMEYKMDACMQKTSRRICVIPPKTIHIFRPIRDQEIYGKIFLHPPIAHHTAYIKMPSSLFPPKTRHRHSMHNRCGNPHPASILMHHSPPSIFIVLTDIEFVPTVYQKTKLFTVCSKNTLNPFNSYQIS